MGKPRLEATTVTVGTLTVKGPNAEGRYVVTPYNQPMINAMPGATSFSTQADGVAAIHVYEAVGRDGAKFWHLMSAIQMYVGKLAHELAEKAGG